ncbi:MAG: hypothetical protein ACP5VE_13675 [Chthonomonadales bacterium]
MPNTGIMTWEWIFLSVTLVPCLGVMAYLLWRIAFGTRPVRTVKLNGVSVVLWVSERKLPVSADAIVAPVAPDLKMAVSIAKWIRDATADAAQDVADAAAPLSPGEVLRAPGARYRFGSTLLAVVMDEAKRVEAEWITAAIANALRRAAAEGMDSVIVPDITEDLLRQPNWITPEQRIASCRPIARALFHGIMEGAHGLDTVHVWVWQPVYADVYHKELDALVAGARAKGSPQPA